MYYTPQFAATTADIQGFVDQVIQETNQGYINSKVPLRAKLHCTEQATINDVSSSRTMLLQFQTMKGDSTTLRGTADAAVLLVNSFSACGIGYLNTIRSGITLSVTEKSCALGYYSFGHEIGHNIGLYHNREVTTNPYFTDGYGYLIPKYYSSSWGSYRTILAYSAPNHRKRINYYSNPDVIYSVTRTATGVKGRADNARVITAQRFDLANVGDESSSNCSPPSTESCAMKGRIPYFKYEYRGKSSQSNCVYLCKNSDDCIAWTWKENIQVCYLFVARLRYSSTHTAGPDPTKESCNLYKPKCTNMGSFPVLHRRYRSRASSADDCHNQCRQQSGCSNWYYGRSGTCNKYGVFLRSNNGWTSGGRYC